MRAIVVGLGIQGKKRARVAGADLVCTVDPVNETADHRLVETVPLDSYDAALVCTPDEVKEEILTYLLKHGKHVLVEKPLFADTAKLKALQSLSERNKAALYTAYNHRFEPFIAKAKDILAAGEIGKPYVLRMFYGNGTARDVRLSAWRDQGMGVLADIGSHLLDIVLFLFGKPRGEFKPFRLYSAENKSSDYVSFGTASGGYPHISLEATLLSWRNTFSFDLFAEGGSLHIDCLCKWGPSTLKVRKRTLPSGRPSEVQEVLEIADPTWELEYRHFLNLCENGGTNIENDIWIGDTLRSVYSAAR